MFVYILEVLECIVKEFEAVREILGDFKLGEWYFFPQNIILVTVSISRITE